jgi:hypothetical protein
MFLSLTCLPYLTLQSIYLLNTATPLSQTDRPTYLTYLPTYLPTYLLTDLPNYSFSSLIILTPSTLYPPSSILAVSQSFGRDALQEPLALWCETQLTLTFR